MNHFSRCFLVLLFTLPVTSKAQEFSFTDIEKRPADLIWQTGPLSWTPISATLLAGDIKMVTGTQPGHYHRYNKSERQCHSYRKYFIFTCTTIYR